jgi:hypothetical protein
LAPFCSFSESSRFSGGFLDTCLLAAIFRSLALPLFDGRFRKLVTNHALKGSLQNLYLN